MGSFTVSVRGVSLDSCIEARAVPVRSCGVDEVWGEALFFSLTRIKLCRVLAEFFSPFHLREFIRWRDPG